MSTNPVLILLHGMGDHTADSFKKDVVKATSSALKRYPSHAKVKIEEKTIIHI